jgi:hypothetical protein
MNRHEDGSAAVRSAAAGAEAWQQAARGQRTVAPDHRHFYDLAGHLVDTLRAINSLAVVLAGQVEGYADEVGVGLAVYDDSRVIDPRDRLVTAALQLRHLAQSAAEADMTANAFWSAISHIGVEEPS